MQLLCAQGRAEGREDRECVETQVQLGGLI